MPFYGQWGSWYEESEHPRGPGGRWTTKGGAGTPQRLRPGRAPETPKQQGAGGLVGFLRGLAEHFDNEPAKFQLAHGKEFKFDSSSFTRGGPIKQCYANAGKLALDDPDMTYVEGYVSTYGVPIQHAWCVDKTGKVVDPTIRVDKKTGDARIAGYFGVPIKTEYLRKAIVRTKYWGVLTDDKIVQVLKDDPADIVELGVKGGTPAQPTGKHPGHGYSKEAFVDEKGVIHTTNVYDAVRALYEDKEVNLNQPREASVLVDKLGAIASRMIDMGKEAPNFDLCKVTIKGTNLFCADAHGLPRIAMPQLKGVPEPGSKASKMHADVRGEVDVTNDFIAYLKEKKYTIFQGREEAANLRPTQGELNGAKVAMLGKYLRQGKLQQQTLFISRDNYIVDGHHRWAAMVAKDFEDNKIGNVKVPVTGVDAGIITLLAEARKFTKEIGIPQISIKSFVEEKKKRNDALQMPTRRGVEERQKPRADLSRFVADLKVRAEELASSLGYDGRLRVSTDEREAFVEALTGRRPRFGSYDPDYREVILHANNLTSLTDDTIDGLVVHEVQHDKFHLVMQHYDNAAFKVAANKLPAMVRSRKRVVLTEVEEAVYDRLHPLLDEDSENWRRLMSSARDVSDYAAEWRGKLGGKPVPSKANFALNETLAEAARVRFRGLPIPKEWDNLLTAFDDVYQQSKPQPINRSSRRVTEKTEPWL